ncbi:MAG: hypothetical protein RLZZ453_472 [Chlamydiota bacterium]|jgi:glycosyltransferase involved in cell wall biosynthesis
MIKSAVVNDWLVTLGGGERTLAAILDALPSPLYTLLYDPSVQKELLKEGIIHPSFIQNLPFSKKKYRYYLPLFPFAIEQFDLSEYDLVLSVSHAVAKGVLTQPHQLHLCYCFTPMRYAWDLTHQYLRGIKGLQKVVAKLSLHYLRNWDIASLGRVDHFAAISSYIARRIDKVYGKKATVIYPPVDVDKIACIEEKESFYLVVSRFVPYKNIDLIVEAFSHYPHKKLVVIGEGPEEKKIKAKAGKNVEFLGFQSDEVVRSLMGKAKGFIFAAEEDFGIVVVEAQAAGTPVIALGKGAALETVIPNKTGLFFKEPTVSSLSEAIAAFETKRFDPQEIAAWAARFSKERFTREFKAFVQKKWEAFDEVRHSSCR